MIGALAMRVIAAAVLVAAVPLASRAGAPAAPATIEYPALGANHSAIAFGAGSAWVLESARRLGGPAKPLGRPGRGCGALVRIGPATLTATGTLGLARCPLALTFGGGSVWVLGQRIGSAGYQLTRVDPRTMTVRASTVVDRSATPQGDTGATSLFLAAGRATVTAAVQSATGATEVVTLAAPTLAPVASATIPPARGEAAGLSANRGGTWLGTTSGWVYRIDSRTGRVRGVRRFGAGVTGLAASDRAIWLTTAAPHPDTLQLNPVTGALEHDTGLPLLRAATDGRAVWGILAAPRHGDYVARIDPGTRTVAAVTSSPARAPASTPDAIGVGGGAAWIVNTSLQTLTRAVG